MPSSPWLNWSVSSSRPSPRRLGHRHDPVQEGRNRGSGATKREVLPTRQGAERGEIIVAGHAGDGKAGVEGTAKQVEGAGEEFRVGGRPRQDGQGAGGVVEIVRR